MSKDELARNLGTIARSGTSEFLKKADEGGGADGNLIGQFGEFALRRGCCLWLDVHRQVLASIAGEGFLSRERES